MLTCLEATCLHLSSLALLDKHVYCETLKGAASLSFGNCIVQVRHPMLSMCGAQLPIQLTHDMLVGCSRVVTGNSPHDPQGSRPFIYPHISLKT